MQKRKGKGNHYTVLEVGAGSGRMSYYLKEKLKHDKNIFIIATDPGSWQLTKHFRVEPYSYQDAIKAFQPNMILTSWMPLGEDWTNVMRRCNSVEEYLLIGEALRHNLYVLIVTGKPCAIIVIQALYFIIKPLA